MSTDYEAIRQKNIKEYGEGSRHLSYFADIYSTRTHFIFEVLQNAEDALSRRPAGSDAGYVHFHLHLDRLEIRHNGAPFNELNVTGICGIGEGTKSGDFTQIGKFGIGFKSVYAYTFFPKIHSGGEHFEIRRFVEPHAITCVNDKDTLIVLPFDQLDKRPAWAFREYVSVADAVREIGDAIRTLGIRTLLFLRHIEEIKWTLPDGTAGQFVRNSEQIANRDGLRKVEVLDQNDLFEEWRIFARDAVVQDAGQSHQVTVEIAFLIKNGAVTRADNTELIVFFPTEKKTELGFLIQAPFKATKARDNIKADDSANRQLIEAAAQLAAGSLLVLRDLGLLNVASYAALPLRAQDFSEGSLFRPVYDKVREALKTQQLLLAERGSFIKADEAKLARGEDLVKLFSPERGISPEQLGMLFGKAKLAWLDKNITNDNYPDLYAYIVGLADGVQVTPEAFAPKLTADFLVKQSIDWLTRFIQYAMQGAQSLRKVPFIRLVSGGHVSLPADKNVLPSAWFAPKESAGLDLSEFPLVFSELAANESIRKLLEKEGIREIDAAAIVGQCILPLYSGVGTPFDEPSYRGHLRQIRKAYTEANEAAKKQLTTNLDGAAWVACIHASGNAPDKIVWKKPGPSDVFMRTNDHEIWFHGLDSVGAYFLHPSVINELNGFVSNLVKPATALTQNLHSSEYTVSLCNESYGNHKQGLNGFKPDATVAGLQSALVNWNKERAIILWNIMLSGPRIISGEIQQSSNRQRLDAAKKELKYTDVGKLCSERDWLPDQAGNFRKPNELFLTDLPEGFGASSIRAKEVAEKLGIRKPEVEQAAETLSKGDPRKKFLLEQIANASDDDLDKYEELVPRTVPPMPAPSFKDGLENMTRQQRGMPLDDESFPRSYPVSKPDYRQENLNQAVADGVQKHASSPRTISFSPLRDQPSNKDARQTLYQEYQGRCQVTGETFQKASASANGEAANYFEVCSLLPYGNADYLNDAGNMLCVSADTMAKLNHASFEWLDDIEHKIAEFDNGGKRAQEIKIRIRLAGEECTITWSQRHFMQLVALYQKA
ncbi:MAG: hypothetical protein COS82_02430 [Zetaproteobacteria bacterium CG06_land_8_20_14_3_00_59_53]|nr:MAG: hypothetical protein COX56_00320 [Zetaproteobacteria bacterium CG23_combo_of_CG06-09_8_20_14_all_59_86]PIQ64719.1 MAG: hypothetical protein COV97_08155 [Zetaproteobacteria bacterium CG11_big_fil_rev_8_21_14_0_20_59_439]PIU71115.1 MAG: hypothetical protein COS82_02430 [Zetaproteobacteria bacterium CG06_land_8_20_14_3_00_59_53]